MPRSFEHRGKEKAMTAVVRITKVNDLREKFAY
jgi:hypothetical protein